MNWSPLWTIWWAVAGVILYEKLNPSQTATVEVYCCQEFGRLNKKLEDFSRKRIILQHDKARAHKRRMISKMEKSNWEVLSHFSCSPNLQSSDYYLFQQPLNQNISKCDWSRRPLDRAFKRGSKTTRLMKTSCKWCARISFYNIA